MKRIKSHGDIEAECYGAGERMFFNIEDGHLPAGWTLIRIRGAAQRFCKTCAAEIEYEAGSDHPTSMTPGMKELLRDRHGVEA